MRCDNQLYTCCDETNKVCDLKHGCYYNDTETEYNRVRLRRIEPTVLRTYLRNHPDQTMVEEVVTGFEKGFDLGLTSLPPPREPCRNSRRVERNLLKTQELVDDEVRKGHILGPFDAPPLPNMVYSPLNIVPKPGTDKWRLIHDLTFPRTAEAVNRCIPEANAKVQYHTINDVIEMALEIGCEAHGARIDINAAFRNLPIRFKDLHLLGFTLNGKFYINSSLPFGASSSCQLFEKVACALEWIVKNETKCAWISHFLDDFPILEQSADALIGVMEHFIQILEHIGMPIAHHKTLGPIQTLEYLGMLLNLKDQTLGIPAAKRNKALKAIAHLRRSRQAKSKTTVKKVQSTAGLLNFICQALPAGRPFLAGLYRLTHFDPTDRQGHHRRVTADIDEDLEMFEAFLNSCPDSVAQTVPFLQRVAVPSASLEFYSDAAGGADLGMGFAFQNHWGFQAWTETNLFTPLVPITHYILVNNKKKKQTQWVATKEAQPNIAILELLAACAAVAAWGAKLSGSRLILRSDNTATVAMINSKKGKNSIMQFFIETTNVVLFKISAADNCSSREGGRQRSDGRSVQERIQQNERNSTQEGPGNGPTEDAVAERILAPPPGFGGGFEEIPSDGGSNISSGESLFSEWNEVGQQIDEGRERPAEYCEPGRKPSKGQVRYIVRSNAEGVLGKISDKDIDELTYKWKRPHYRAVNAFEAACREENLPIKMGEKQFAAFLGHLHACYYTAGTLDLYFTVFKKMAKHADFVITKKMKKEFEKVRADCRPQRDAKIPVSPTLLAQFLKGANKTSKGYRRKLYRATFVCAWAGSLRVCEYSKNRYPHQKNHNLLPDGVYITSEGIGFEFKSDKTTKSSSPVQHRFCTWGKLPPEARQIMEEYMAARPKGLAEHFFCWEYGEQLTYSDVQNMIDTCLLHTEYSNINITSHCFRSSRASMMTLDGTNYIDCARQGRWRLNSTAMEAYTKGGLATMTEPELLNKNEKYRKSWTQARLKYITRFLIQTEQLTESHEHYSVVKRHMFGDDKYTAPAVGRQDPSAALEECLPQISFPHPDCLGRDRRRATRMLQKAKQRSKKIVAEKLRHVNRVQAAGKYRDRASTQCFWSPHTGAGRAF